MDAETRNALAAQLTLIYDLDRRTRNIPARFAGGGDPVTLTVAIIGGNVLSSGAQGIKSVSTLTSVPVKYDPTTDTSMVDGVGYGFLGLNGDYSALTKVLVVNNGGGLTFNSFPLIANNVIISSGTISIPVGAGPDSIDVYTVG